MLDASQEALCHVLGLWRPMHRWLQVRSASQPFQTISMFCCTAACPSFLASSFPSISSNRCAVFDIAMCPCLPFHFSPSLLSVPQCQLALQFVEPASMAWRLHPLLQSPVWAKELWLCILPVQHYHHGSIQASDVETDVCLARACIRIHIGETNVASWCCTRLCRGTHSNQRP